MRNVLLIINVPDATNSSESGCSSHGPSVHEPHKRLPPSRPCGAASASYVPRADRDYAIAAGLEMLTLRHAVDEADGLYTVRADEARLIAYYANSIAHLLPGSAVHRQAA